jgi:hypothetical protein
MKRNLAGSNSNLALNATSSGVDFIIFHRNAFTDVEDTIINCINVCEELNMTQYQILVIDDRSSPVFIPSEYMTTEKSHRIRFILNEGTPGISGAIHYGLKFTKFDSVFPIPGHNMYSVEAIRNVLKLRETGDLVLGARTNRREARPLAKRLASNLVRAIYRVSAYYYVADFHGLLICKRYIFERFMTSNLSYGHQIIVLTSAIKAGCSLVQTIAPLNLEHNKRSSKKISESFPSPAGIWGILMAMIIARKIVRGGAISE